MKIRACFLPLLVFLLTCAIPAAGEIHPAGPLLGVHGFAGADAAAKLANCLAALPATGGTCDMRGFRGAQTMASDFCAGVVKPAWIVFGPGSSYTISANVTCTSNIGFQFDGAGALSIDGGFTLNIQGPLRAPLVQLFGGAGTVSFAANASLTTLYPQWWGAVCNAVANDYAALNAAITAAGAAVTIRPSRVELRGICAIGTTLSLSGMVGVEIAGASGPGFGSNPGASIYWSGAANGTVMSLGAGVQGCSLHDFRIDGAGSASMGLALPGGASSSFDNDIQRVAVWNVTGVGAIGVQVGDATNRDVSNNRLSKITVGYNAGTMTAALVQDGNQTVGTTYDEWRVVYTGAGTRPTYWAHFINGDMSVYNWKFLGDTTSGQVVTEAAVYWRRILNTYHENGSGAGAKGPAFDFISGNSPLGNTTMIGTRIQWLPTDAGNTIFRYNQNAPLTMMNITVDNGGVGAGDLTWNNTSGSGTAKIFLRNFILASAFTTTVPADPKAVIDSDSTVNLCYGAATPCQAAVFSATNGYGKQMYKSPDPRVFWWSTAAAANGGLWDCLAGANTFVCRTLNDAFGGPNTWVTVTRTAGSVTVTGVDFPTGRTTALLWGTDTNCSSSASPAVCAAAPAGSVTIAAAATTKVVNTTAVTANSQIFIQEDSSLGTKLGVTCNVTTGRIYTVSARTAATSFTITASAAPVTNPACLSYTILN